MNRKTAFLTGTLLAALAVLLGAFGAHALKNVLAASGKKDIWTLAISYMFYHVPAFLALGLLPSKWKSRWINISSWLLIAGVTCFSGSLLILCIIPLGPLNLVTPLGGLLLIAGWLAIALGVATKKKAG